MYHILCGLVGTLAPIVSFTADEIYEALPGPKEKSVHLTEFPKLDAAMLSPAVQDAWQRILQLREEADITVYGDFSPEALLGPVKVDLAKMFIVSHVNFKPLAQFSGNRFSLNGIGPVGVSMSAARGKKCGRCWNYREEVAEDGGLCARCEAIVSGLAPPEAPAA